MSCESILEDGYLTEEIRQKLQEKIEKSGMSKSAIARRFGVSAVTFYKWLKGETVRCSIAARRKIFLFLQEKEDGALSAEHPKRPDIGALPDSMLLCMERVSKVYDLVNTNSEKAKYFIGAIDQAALEALEHLLNLKELGVMNEEDEEKE